MDGLRWLLLVIGLLVIVGVYLYSRRTPAGSKAAAPTAARREPTLPGAEALDDEDDAAEPSVDLEADIITETKFEPSFDARREPSLGLEADAGDAEEADDESPREPAPQKIVALRIIARGGGAFKGDDLIMGLRGIGMRHGKFGIFHRLDGTDDGEAIFSAASLIEPGSFDLANIRDQAIPGISLFAVLPGPIGSLDAFDLLMSAARTLAQSLEGELLDESGSTLSIQRERYMREEVVQYQHAHKVA